ncbi:MAG: amidohydrolase family protein [Thiolinea sp.]
MLNRTYSGPKPAFRLPPGSIDTQLHLYQPGFPALPGGPAVPVGTPGLAEYRQVMDWLGIERFVITQGNAHQFDNSCLLACLAEAGEQARGVAVIRGDTPDAELQRLHAAGVRGARIMDLPGGAAGLPMLAEVDARARAMGWCVAVQFDGSRIREHMPLLSRLQSRFIIDHHGKVFAGSNAGFTRGWMP